MSLSDLFISSAHAQAAAPAADNGQFSFVILFVMVIVFYFLLIRPQQKRAKEQRAMMDALQKGDEVVTVGGMVGRVAKLDDNYIGVEVADGVVVQIQKSALQTTLPKGTIKSL
ncbi:MAG: preprotein translocase subunit YajC [Gallionellaceae bacterium]|jgi:preprotein translocase subunit YajC|nr:preprotein translocase subunit YajC [Gallionellaceae bacterium]